MKDYDLVLYGSQNLTGGYINVSEEKGDGEHSIDIRRISNAMGKGTSVVSTKLNEKDIKFNGYVVSDDYKSIKEILEELNVSLNNQDRYLRISKVWAEVMDTSSEDGWNVIGDSTSKELDYDERQFTGSVMFNVDVVGSGDSYYGGLENDELDGLDLLAYDGTGDFEFSLYIPDVEFVESVEITIGSDDSNYLVKNITNQYDGEAIESGWNWFSFAWTDGLETGTVDAGLIGRYVQVKINYSDQQADLEGFRLGSVIWVDRISTINYRCYETVLGFNKQHRDWGEFSLSFLNYEGTGESTSLETAFLIQKIDEVSYDFDVYFYGSHTPEPIITFVLNTSVVALNKIVITNLTTGDNAELDETWAVGDTVVINTKEKWVKLNNEEIDYDSVLPRFVIGKNEMNITLVDTGEDLVEQTTQNVDLKGEV